MRRKSLCTVCKAIVNNGFWMVPMKLQEVAHMQKDKRSFCWKKMEKEEGEEGGGGRGEEGGSR